MYQIYRMYVSKIESVCERARRGFFRAQNSDPMFIRHRNHVFVYFNSIKWVGGFILHVFVILEVYLDAPRLEGVRSTGGCVWSLLPQGRRGGGGRGGSQTPVDPKGSADHIFQQ